MKKIYNFVKLICVLVTLFSVKANAQCLQTFVFGAATINSAAPGNTIVSTCNYGGDRSTLTFNVIGSFTITSSSAGDYFTVTDMSNNVLVTGFAPLAAAIPSVASYYLHISSSGPPSCGTAQACRTVAVNVPLPTCSGMPVAGTVPANYSICPNSVTNITATGATIASGITYQWMQAPAASGPWTNVTTGSGFNTASLTTASLTSLTFYQMVITCTNSSQSATTSVVSVNPNNAVNLCYCVNGLGGGGCFGNNITNVSILSTPLNNSSGCGTNSNGDTYTQYMQAASTTATLNAGSSYSMSINTTANNNISFWIDYNHSGTFDANEYNLVTASSTANAATILYFNVPSTALGGVTGMRVRSHDSFATVTANDACSNFYEGETEDYFVTINPAAPCSGVPNPGTITATPTLVCSGTGVNMNLSGFTVASGLTFQWQTSANNTTWTAVPGATNTSLSQTITAATYYQVIVSCGTNTAATASIQFSLSPPTLCYCNTNLGGSGCSPTDIITNVSILGTPFNNTSSCNSSPTNGTYSNFPPGPGTTATLNIGLTYSISVNTTANNIESVWIDYNQSGTFDASEHTQICLVSTPSVATIATFTVPGTALLGQTGMRVRSRLNGNQNGPNDACITMGSGETEDYMVTIAAATACSGTPGANTVVASQANVCPSGSVTLGLANSYTVGGLTYQWFTAPAVSGPYTAVSGATVAVYNATNLTANTFFQAVITCTNGPASVTATPVQVTVSGNPCQCAGYCSTSLPSQTADDEIFNVSIGTLNNTSTCAQTGGPGSILNRYSNYSGMVAAPNLTVTNNYTLDVTVGQCGSSAFSGGVTVYIDYNQNGVFTDPGEQVFVSASTTWAIAGTLVSTVITIPANATPGITRMRVIAAESTIGAGSCAGYGYGETEDYCVNIAPGTPCAGTPAANSAVASSTNVCPAGSSNLSLATSYTLGGLTYQWFTSPAVSGPYTAVSGATTSAYSFTNISTSLYYQAVITCTNGPASTTSSPVYVMVGGTPCQCAAYCSSNATSVFDAELFNVSIGSLNNTSNCSQTGSAPTSTVNLYSNYTGIIAAPNLAAGLNYTLSVTAGQCNNFATSGIVTAYIDYNQNASFADPGELVYSSPYSVFAVTGTTFTTVIQIPTNATIGTSRIRVIASQQTSPQADCGTYFNGETEDYCINITAPTPCTGSPAANTSVASSTMVCSGGTSTLNVSTSYTVGGLSYQWQTSPNLAGPYTAVSGATTVPYTFTNITNPLYYSVVITCSSTPVSTTATPVFVNILGAPVYASVPFLENFDNTWQNRCDNHNVPVAANWDSNPTTGNQSWRRQDDGVSANWTAPTTNTVAPLTGAGCANFHTWYAPFNTSGDLSLYVNMGTPSTYSVSFYYKNISGTDSLQVFFSNNGGNTFTYKSGYYVDINWNKKTIVLPSVNSSSCVIKFTATSDFGFSDIAIDSLQIQSSCAAPVLTLTASQSTVCNGNAVTLTASGATTYTWNTTAQTASISVTPSVNTTYTVTGENTPGCPATKTIAVTVNPSPTLAVAPSTSICPGANAVISATSSAANYTWNPGNFTTSAITVSPSISTVYNVATTNSLGCVTNSNVTVFVVVCTGIAKNTVIDNSTFIYPNPNSGNINVVISDANGNYAFEVLDLAGRVVYKTTLTKTESALSIKELANGMYTYKITSLTTKVAIKEGKLIKE